MRLAKRMAWQASLALALLISLVTLARADETTFCLTCTEPARSYSCKVKTPDANPGPRALRLYCIVRTARDGGHNSCRASTSPRESCKGKKKTYTYKGPAIPKSVQSQAEKLFGRNQPKPEKAEKKEEPSETDTLVGLTTRAVKSSREGLSGAGSGVRDATRGTTERVGNAARNTYRCVTSLFRDCWSSDEDDPDAGAGQEADRLGASTEPQ